MHEDKFTLVKRSYKLLLRYYTYYTDTGHIIFGGYYIINVV
jgi:hypothetical protein